MHFAKDQSNNYPWPDGRAGAAPANHAGALVYRYPPRDCANLLPAPGLAGEWLLRLLCDLQRSLRDVLLAGASPAVAAVPPDRAAFPQHAAPPAQGAASAAVGFSSGSLGGRGALRAADVPRQMADSPGPDHLGGWAGRPGGPRCTGWRNMGRQTPEGQQIIVNCNKGRLYSLRT